METNKDVVILAQMRAPDGTTISARPCHLLTVKKAVGTKGTQASHFISLDKPDFTQAGWVQVKGFFCDQDEEVILANYKQIVQETGKELVTEMYFPRDEIKRIKSLVFKAK